MATDVQELTTDVRPWLHQGLAAAHAGDRAEARRYFEAARNLQPNNLVALLWLAWLAPTRRESLSLFCRVLELDPHNKRAQAGIDWMRSRPEIEGDPALPLAQAGRGAVRLGPLTRAEVAQGTSIPRGALIDGSHLTRPRPVSALEEPAAPARRVFSFSFSEITLKSLGLRVPLRRVTSVLVTLSIILLLTLFGLIVAERGQARVPADPLSAAGEALNRAVAYAIDHPATYYWHREEAPALGLVATTFARSGGLLLLALAVATGVGIPLGVGAALTRRERGAPLVLLLSILGVSTPSFLLAMLIGVVNIKLHQRLGIQALPPNGFGWDAHLVMPALVLAARPLAQIVQITYVSMSDILRQDYIRVAQAKGLRQHVVLSRHALRNARVPILTTLSTSLRLSLASLPVVEFFFIWPGLGLTLLQAIELGMASLVADLILALGLLFLLVNLGLDLIYPVLDPRLRGVNQATRQQAQSGWQSGLEDLLELLATWWASLRSWLPGSGRDHPLHEPLEPLPKRIKENNSSLTESSFPPVPPSPRRQLWRGLGNPMLIMGTLLVLAFLGLALFGARLTEASPYQTHGVKIIEGEIGVPPFSPSALFRWGTDQLGRDMQALVLAGAKQTLALALLAMMARMLVGTLFGTLAGWWRGGRLDRLLTGAIGVWAAFPVTLFAIIVIQALGIEKGMSIFVVALCVVGWAEIAQFVRGQVTGIKPQLHIEAARALGASTGQILTRHVLPLLLPSLLVLAALEMGGVLMLLSELGFLNIFLGGGFKVDIAEGPQMTPIIVYYSDVPEWGALLANIRGWWRAYPWLAWYPGIFFFLAILAFNLWGEGLRRWLDQTRVNVSRLFSRTSLAGVVVLVLGLGWVLRSTAPLGVYSAQARQFDAGRAIEDIRTLTSPQFGGRETGTPGAKLAAEYIAARMKEIGLQPAGQKETYLQTFACPWLHLAETPRFEILDEEGDVAEALVYREDFAEFIGPLRSFGEFEGAVVGLGLGPNMGGNDAPYRLAGLALDDNVVLMREADMARINPGAMGGVLVISDDPTAVQRKYVFPKDSRWTWGRSRAPVLTISQATAERLLATTGSNLAKLDEAAAGLQAGEVALTGTGVGVHMQIVATQTEDTRSEQCYNVIGFIPGIGARMSSETGRGLDSQVIMVHAYYDGVGLDPDGVLYPGANDNASGIASMLEIARVLKEGDYQPKKTVVFVAWSGGERGQNLGVRDVMNAKLGFSSLTVEGVIELSGVGAGQGKGIALGDASSYRLVQLFQKAAGRMGASTTTRGRDPHFGTYVGLPTQTESALPMYVSWDGSDRIAHTAGDTWEAIDPQKLEEVGQTVLLSLTVLSREVEY